jgi:hypothetical protein
MQLSRSFGCQPTRVKAALDNRAKAPKVRRCHMAVDENPEAEILEWIDARAEKCNPVTRTDLQHYCEVKYPILISRGWADSFILRHRDDLTETKSTLQEETRLEVPHAFMDQTIHRLREYVQEMKAELVFNLDEVDMSEWEDRKDKKVIVTKTIAGQTIHHCASRNVKYISIITCITAA